MKTAGKVLAGAAALAVLIWAGIATYWYFKIYGGIRAMESGAAPAKNLGALPYTVPEEPLQEIRAAGCRAFPYLVESLDPGGNPAYLVVATEILCKGAEAKPSAHQEFPPEMKILYEDSAEDRTKKCNQIKAWWRLHGPELHQGWRVWSGRCAGE
jgi:hypothetical protein